MLGLIFLWKFTLYCSWTQKSWSNIKPHWKDRKKYASAWTVLNLLESFYVHFRSNISSYCFLIGVPIKAMLHLEITKKCGLSSFNCSVNLELWRFGIPWEPNGLKERIVNFFGSVLLSFTAFLLLTLSLLFFASFLKFFLIFNLRKK